jgi:hypothetical protein
MRIQFRVTLIFALCALAPSAFAIDTRVLSAADVVAEIAATGRIEGPATVEDDLDLGRLSEAAGKSPGGMVFNDVRFRGRLTGAPSVHLRIQGGSVCRIEADGLAWPQAVDIRGATIGAARFRSARMRGAWSCFECALCRTNFEEVQFADEASFTGTRFGAATDPDLCRESAPAACGTANFAEASFAATARFDRAAFQSRASFDGAEFRDAARFARASATQGMSAIGTRFRRDAEFRDCVLTDAYFGPDTRASGQTTFEATEFTARADFRGCRFAGTTHFDAAVFAGDALFTRARFTGPDLSFLGVLAAHAIDLRAAGLSDPTARLALDATAADAIRLDWDSAGDAILRALPGLPAEQRVSTLDALSRTLDSQGETRAGLRVAFAAKQARRDQQASICGDDSVAGCAAGEAEWWLWTWPTRNGSDLAWPLAALGLLWGMAALVGLPRGRVLAVPGEPADGGAAYRCVTAGSMPDGTWCPTGLQRAEMAIGFATRLVFKLGPTQLRMAAPTGGTGVAATNLALRLAWVLGWALLGLVAAVIAAAFPGLRAILP